MWNTAQERSITIYKKWILFWLKVYLPLLLFPFDEKVYSPYLVKSITFKGKVDFFERKYPLLPKCFYLTTFLDFVIIQ